MILSGLSDTNSFTISDNDKMIKEEQRNIATIYQRLAELSKIKEPNELDRVLLETLPNELKESQEKIKKLIEEIKKEKITEQSN